MKQDKGQERIDERCQMLQRIHIAVISFRTDDSLLHHDQQLHFSDLEGASSSGQDHGGSRRSELIVFSYASHIVCIASDG